MLGAAPQTLKGHTDCVLSVALLPNRKLVAFGRIVEVNMLDLSKSNSKNAYIEYV